MIVLFVRNAGNWGFTSNNSTPSPYPPPSSQGWTFSPNGVQKPSQTSPKNTTSSDPWKKLEPNSSSAWDKFDTGKTPPPKDENIWDKFDTGKTPPPTDWGKLTQQPPKEAPVPIPDENIWDKFDNIWKKLTTSVSSIWNKILNWFN